MDTPRTLAADLIADAGRTEALLYLAREVLTAASWREARNGLAIMWAVLRAN